MSSIKRTVETTREEVEQKKDADGLMTFKKIGGGTLRLPRGRGKIRIIKSGQVFSAYPDEIPVTHRDTIIPVSGGAFPSPTSNLKPKVEEYVLQRDKSAPIGESNIPMFNVVDSSNKKINESPMTKDKALELISKLSS